MAAMDSAKLHQVLDSSLTAKSKAAQASGKKKKRNTATGETTLNNSLTQTENTSTGDWYFGNPSAVALGQSEFIRIWGNIPLEDNWRRSNKSSNTPDAAATVAVTASEDTNAPKPTQEDARATEIAKVFAQMPRTEEDKQQALDKIEEATFQLGDIFFLQLNERNNAATSYRQLLSRFPGSDHEPEVLYKLYLIEKENPQGSANLYADQLKTKYPSSTFARVLLNPDYLKEASVAAEKQKLIYKEAYQAFASGNLRAAQEKTSVGLALGETSFNPQLELLRILITGKTEDVTKYQYELGEFLKKFPDSHLKPYAEQLLAASKSFIEKTEKAKGIRFAAQDNAPHYLVLVYNRESKIANEISEACEQFNSALKMRLQTSNLVFTDELALTMISDLPEKNAALEYFDKITASLAQRNTLATFKFDTFVISKDNFQIFYRTKALDEYLTFFDRNYKRQNQ
jgi:hypothetical protein